MSGARRGQDPELLRRLLRAKDRIDAASHEEWSVRRLAQVSGVSEAHFARSFKEAFGVPPHRYLLTRRLQRAKAMLRDTDLSITEIAFQTGWRSLGTFGRTFRDVMGESAGELRARERAARHDLEGVPPCYLSAAQRPDLRIAVSEKRRRRARDEDLSDQGEVSRRGGRPVASDPPGRGGRDPAEAREGACSPAGVAPDRTDMPRS